MKLGSQTVAAMKLGGVDVSAAYLGADQVFGGGAGPVFPDDYYGTGPGLITTHWDFRAAAASQGLADGAVYGATPNLGGDGAAFDLTPGPVPGVYDAALDGIEDNGLTTSRMEIADHVDMVGAHTLFAAYLKGTGAVTFGCDTAGAGEFRYIPSNNRINITTATTTLAFLSVTIPVGEWFVGEIVADGSTVELLINGVSLGSQACVLSPGQMAIDTLFNRASYTVPWAGYCTDVMGVALGNPANVTAARQYLADRAGVTL